MEKYQILCQIGKGSCGAVFLVNDVNKKLYALKKIQLDESRKTRTKEAVQREAKILSGMKHPHIVTYLESFFDEADIHLCIIQDYCDGGTLDDRIRDASQKKEHFSEKQILSWFLQVALAVRYMHSKKVLHRDIKAQNVFLNKGGTLCKLGDFGIAKSMDTDIDVASTCVGTPCYLSPEMCQDIPYSSKADVWAMGCMLYEMTTLKPAFDAFNLISLFYKIVKGEYEPIPSVFSKDLSNLIATVLIRNPDERPSAGEILSILYVRQELQNFIEEKEFILQNRRLPTRQGSRPYSTPSLSRSNQGDGGGAVLTLEATQVSAQPPRAISCRPNLSSQNVAFSNKEILPEGVRPPGRSGRVSTIPEETEDQLLERSLRTLDGQSLVLKLPGIGEKKEFEKLQKANGVAKSSNNKTSSNAKPIPKTSLKTGSSPKKSPPLQMKRPSSAQHSVISEVSSSTMRPSSSNYDSRHEKEKTELPTDDLLVPLVSSEESTPSELTLSPRSVQTARTITPRNIQIPKISLSSEADPPKRNRIQEPQRTPRIQEKNALLIQFEEPDSHRLRKPSPCRRKSSDRANRRSGNRANEGFSGWNNKVSSSRRRSGQLSCKSSDTRPTTRESTVIDYYSDDFDDTDTSSYSDYDDDIPEEISYGHQRSVRGAHSLSQTIAAQDVESDLEIPEIEEDLPDGLVADDDDDFGVDDEVSEDLDEVLIEARMVLQSADIREEVVTDDRRPNTSKFIRNHCIDALGKEKFEKVRKYCESSNRPEIKKLEKMVGKEHAKTVFLMAEISHPHRR